MVSIRRVKEVREIDDPNTLGSDAALRICNQDPTSSKWTCQIFERPTEPFANFDSEGVEIDKIGFIPGERGQP